MVEWLDGWGTIAELTLISNVAGCESKWNLAREPKTSGADQCRGCSMAILSRTSKLQKQAEKTREMLYMRKREIRDRIIIMGPKKNKKHTLSVQGA